MIRSIWVARFFDFFNTHTCWYLHIFMCVFYFGRKRALVLCLCGVFGTSRGLGFLPVSPRPWGVSSPPLLPLPHHQPEIEATSVNEIFLEVTFGLAMSTVPCVPFMNWPQGGEIVLTRRVWNNSGGGGGCWKKKLEQWEKRSSWRLGRAGSLGGARDRVSHTPHWRRNETMLETETVARATTKAGWEK